MVGTARAIDETSRSPVWLSYFSMAVSGGYAWSHSPFSPVARAPGCLRAHRLLRDGQEAYPDLSEIAVGLDGDPQAPTLNLTSPHPYITRFAVHDRDGESILQVATGPRRTRSTPRRAATTRELAVVTDYGSCRPHRFIYDVV